MEYTRKQVEHYARLWIAEVQDAGLLTPVSGVATVHVFGGTLGDPYRIDVEWEGSNEHKYEGSTRFGLSLFGVYDAETAFRIVRSALTTLRAVNHVHNYNAQALAIGHRRAREQRAHAVAVRAEYNYRWLLGHRED